MRYLIAFALCFSACVGNPVPQDVLDWRFDAIPVADSLAINTIATRAGIRAPYSLAPPFSYYVGCPELLIVSDTIQEGDRRSWTELRAYRKGRDSGGHRCKTHTEPGDTVWQADAWIASSAGRTEESDWRIRDGSWHIDVFLGTGVSYDSATLIVQAIRRKTLVNQIPPPLRHMLCDTLPSVDASDIQEISKGPRETPGYEVRTGRGYVLYVSIVAGQVQVDNVGSWRS